APRGAASLGELLRSSALDPGGALAHRTAATGGRAQPPALRWTAAAAGPRPCARRRPRADLPRRAHHRLRPGGQARSLVGDLLAARPRKDDPADDALP